VRSGYEGQDQETDEFFIPDNLSQKYMKFPSIHSVVKGARQTFFRFFPLAILMAVVGTKYCIRMVYLVDQENESPYWYRNIIATAYLGMLLSIALTVMAEKESLDEE